MVLNHQTCHSDRTPYRLRHRGAHKAFGQVSAGEGIPGTCRVLGIAVGCGGQVHRILVLQVAIYACGIRFQDDFADLQILQKGSHVLAALVTEKLVVIGQARQSDIGQPVGFGEPVRGVACVTPQYSTVVRIECDGFALFLQGGNEGYERGLVLICQYRQGNAGKENPVELRNRPANIFAHE